MTHYGQFEYLKVLLTRVKANPFHTCLNSSEINDDCHVEDMK